MASTLSLCTHSVPNNALKWLTHFSFFTSRFRIPNLCKTYHFSLEELHLLMFCTCSDFVLGLEHFNVITLYKLHIIFSLINIKIGHYVFK